MVNKHPLAINKAIDMAVPPRSAAANARLVLPSSEKRLSLLGSLGWAGAAPKPHAPSSDANPAIERLSEVVPWSVLVWFRRQRAMKIWVCDAHDFCLAAVGGPLCARAVGPRAAVAPVALHLKVDEST